MSGYIYIYGIKENQRKENYVYKIIMKKFLRSIYMLDIFFLNNVLMLKKKLYGQYVLKKLKIFKCYLS